MISKMFLLAVKLCLSASIVTGLVLILRLALKKAPKSLVCALWILVGLRLVIPVMPASKVSVIPEAVSGGTAVEALEKQYVEKTTVIREDQNEELYKQITALYTELPVYREAGTSYVVVAAPAAQSVAPAAQPSAPASQPAAPTAPAAAAYAPPKTFGDSVVPALSVVWIAGVGVMLLYMIGSYLRLYRRLRTAVIREKGVWESDQISSPFILGILRPRIYLPMSLSEEERQFVLAHERMHIRRGDQIWKPLSFVLLAVYWFNPLFWLAYFLVCRDIESACDESVIRSEGTAYRKAYSETLLKLNVRQKAVTACPLAFAENSVGGRIRSILNYKKPAFWLVVTALVISVVAAGCALTDPTKKETPAPESTEQTETEASTEESTEAESTASESTATETEPAESTEAETEPAPSETAEKSSYFEMLYANGKALDADELKKLASFLENDYQPLPWAFLGQDFRDPSEIDVIDLFYNWTEELSGEAEQEAAWKAGHLEEWRLETQKRTAKGMNEAFRKYTGKDLAKEQTDAFSRWIYLPEYDAYYSFQTDSNLPGVALGRACLLDEKDVAHLGLKAGDEQLIALEWTALNNGSVKPADAGMMILTPVENGWQIVANMFYTEPTTETDQTPTEPEPVQAERTECTTKVLEGSMKDEKAGLTFIDSLPVYSYGPADFALISENDIVILDSAAYRLQRYKDGQYFETISLPEEECKRLCVMGENAYVLMRGSLLKIDLNTKEQSTVALPYLTKDEGQNILGLYVNDMLEQDGKLYLVTEVYGNFCLNEATQEVEKTASTNVPYRSWRDGGLGGKEIRVVKGDRRWTINAPNRSGDVIGFGEDGIVYFYLEDENLKREDEGYCRILKCAAGEGVAAESFVDCSKWIFVCNLHRFAKLGADGSVYVLALHENDFAVYKLNVGVEDIREQ